MPDADTVIALILLAVVGASIGNYVTTIVFRLPRGIPVFKEKPMCDACKTPLATRDLYPAVSYLINRCRCRFCGTRIPAEYLLIEVGCMLCFCIAYLQHGVGDAMILTALSGSALIAIAAISYQGFGVLIPPVLGLMAFAATWRGLQDGTIFSMVQDTFWAGVVALAWMLGQKMVKYGGVVSSNYIKLFPAMAALLGFVYFVEALVAGALAAALLRPTGVRLTSSAGIAIAGVVWLLLVPDHHITWPKLLAMHH